MKKNIVLIFLALVILPACFNRKKAHVTECVTKTHEMGSEAGDKKTLYVDDIDAFVFEDENNPLSSEHHTGSGIRLTETLHDGFKDDESAAFKSLYFDFDKHSLKNDQKAALSYDIQRAREFTKQGKMIVIEGHACDSAGSPIYNMQLSHKRAEEVKKEFVKAGIQANMLKAVGRGSEMRIVHGGTREEQGPNRRVEFHVLSEQF